MNLAELKAALTAKRAEAKTLSEKKDWTAEDITQSRAIGDEIKTLEARIELAEKAQEDFARSVGGVTVNSAAKQEPAAPAQPPAATPDAAQAAARAAMQQAAQDQQPPSALLPNPQERSNPQIETRSRNPEKVYEDITQQLKDVRTMSDPHASFTEKEKAHGRLNAVKEARIAKGNTLTDDEGGWAVQTDVSTEIMRLTYDKSPLAQRCRELTLSDGATSIKLPYLKDKDRTQRMVSVYWAQEGQTVTESGNAEVGFQTVELKKLMAFWSSTDELMRHASVVQNLTLDQIADEIQFVVEEAILRGNGTTQLKGILNSDCLITINKETNQAADSFVFENLVKMNAAVYGDSGIVFLNREVEAVLPFLKLDVGLGGTAIYMPSNGAEDGPKVGRLYGMPMVRSEHMSALGDLGDIAIMDLSQYALIRQGTTRFDTSMHVSFLTDEMKFRFVVYIGGAPLWRGVHTPYKGARTRAPFVTLQARA